MPIVEAKSLAEAKKLMKSDPSWNQLVKLSSGKLLKKTAKGTYYDFKEKKHLKGYD